MRRLKKAASVLLVLSLPGILAPADRKAGSFSVNGFAGPCVLLGPSDFRQYYRPRVGFGGMLRYSITEKSVIGIGYLRIPYRLDRNRFEKELRDGIRLSELDVLGLHTSSLNVLLDGGGLTANLFSINFIRYFTRPESRTGLYLTGGFGYCLLDFNDLTVDGSIQGTLVDSSTGTTVPVDEPIGRITYSGGELKKNTGMENRSGLNAGLGFEFRIWKNVTVFAESKYHCVLTEAKTRPAGSVGGVGSGSLEKTGGKVQWISTMAGFRAGL